MSVNPNEDNCSICYNLMTSEQFKAVSCTHIFHTSCIDKWLKINNSCPICRSVTKKSKKNYCGVIFSKDVSVGIRIIIMLLYIIYVSVVNIKFLERVISYDEPYDFQKINTCARIDECDLPGGSYREVSSCQHYSSNIEPKCTKECFYKFVNILEKIECISVHLRLCEAFPIVTYIDPNCPTELRNSWIKEHELNNKEKLLYWTGLKPIYNTNGDQVATIYQVYTIEIIVLILFFIIRGFM